MQEFIQLAKKFDPSGKFLIAANQDSDSLAVFKIDAATGGRTSSHTKHEAVLSLPVTQEQNGVITALIGGVLGILLGIVLGVGIYVGFQSWRTAEPPAPELVVEEPAPRTPPPIAAAPPPPPAARRRPAGAPVHSSGGRAR